MHIFFKNNRLYKLYISEGIIRINETENNSLIIKNPIRFKIDTKSSPTVRKVTVKN
jgi:hypothetical protein